jgi:hypothetical protein
MLAHGGRLAHEVVTGDQDPREHLFDPLVPHAHDPEALLEGRGVHRLGARGRGERINGTFQDRLVAELDHHHITDPVAATDYLNRVFIPKYGKHFGVKPRDSSPAFRPVPAGLDLRTVLCAKTTREVANDNTISYQGQIYQLKPNTRTVCIAGTKVSVQEWFDSSIHVRHDRAGTIPVQERTIPTRPGRQIARSPYDILAVV